MTSETEAIKTNEFLRRRKLRLQQVREQSKDIAKKIRQRAKVEKFRQVVDLDAKKQKEYFECQERLVKRLEVLYARRLDNVGASHQSASELTQQDEVVKTDLSKVRGKEATAELRRKKQEKLDHQKKLLDRKLKARETANEISRDKTSVVVNKLLSKPSTTKVSDDNFQKPVTSELANTKEGNKDDEKSNVESEAVKTSDMATQWDMENMPHEWEPAVPALSLPIDKDTPKDSDDNPGSKSENNKRLDLFALSKEMPSSLRGKHTHEIRERETGRPSLTLVSEYLQSRKLRLREPETANTNKKGSDDMHSIKQTILRSRTSKPEVPGKATANNEKGKQSPDITLHRKNSVMMYNHSTRDTRDLPCTDNKLVVRDLQSEEDAYSQAMREVSVDSGQSKEHQKKVQDMRNKVAVTKQNVEKEYKDTMNFLNSLPKDKCGKVIKNAYMDERRQQIQQENRQQKMQQEYRKIERECRRHQCVTKSRSKSKSPAKQDIEDNFESRDLQYSWMPVPESDSNLAIHAIPNSVKHGKSGNTVKFSKVDSYHEYRSRHKHTPPTKDTTHDKQSNKTVVETVIIDNDATETSDSSSVTSDTSSVENLRVDKKTKGRNAKEINKNLSDAERIIIYKILDSRAEKKSKRQTKLLNEIAKSLTCIEKVQKPSEEDAEQVKKHATKHVRSTSKSADDTMSFEQLHEGVYKMVEEQGDNVASMYFSDRDKVADEKPDDVQNQCSCKKQAKDLQQDKRTPMHWESGDCLQPVRTTKECECPGASKEKCSKSPPKLHPSSAPSTSSFITATNDKGGAAEGGYIKLVDETGQEAGKFFLGAAGFLHNNAYEVVIQLRKKDGVTEEKLLKNKTVVNNDNNSNNENNKSNEKERPISPESVNTDQPASDAELREVLRYRSVTDEDSKMIPPRRLEHDLTNSDVQSEEVKAEINIKGRTKTNNESGDFKCVMRSTPEKKSVCDKGVHAGKTHAPKLDPLPRPATTTYTQTTLSSPIHRPVFFHMSSSTSTAYMSPPEMILPKFLRRKYPMDEDAMYDPIETIEMTENEYCEEYAGCTCRKCVHARKVTVSKMKVPVYCRKNKYERKSLSTPPNSVQSPTDLHEAYGDSQERKLGTACNTARLDKPKCKHHCNENVQQPVKRHCHKNNRPVENIRSSRNVMHVGMNLTSRNKYKTTNTTSIDKKRCKSNLNPIIKDYVNKLLALNREGLKVVEVADQECSSVGTPGSSIINVPYNVDERKGSVANTISLEQIKDVLKRQIVEEQLSNNLKYIKHPVGYTTQNKSNLKHSSSRTCRRKPVHKVKSLNISKNLLKKSISREKKSNKPGSPSSTDDNSNTRVTSVPTRQPRSKSSLTPRQVYTLEPVPRFNDSETTAKNSTCTEKTDEYNCKSGMTVTTKSNSPPVLNNQPNLKRHCGQPSASHRIANLPESEVTVDSEGYKDKTDNPVSMSTQTNQNIDPDAHFMKLAEDKLQNMEKIADLTEKCTKRLSNLAKVLEEVRKNKSLAYSQISSAESTDSQSDHKSENVVVTPVPFDPNNIQQRLDTKSPESVLDKDNTVENEKLQAGYMHVLTDIPQPVFKVPDPLLSSHPKSTDTSNSPLNVYDNTAEFVVKSKQKPPPALSRLNFKHGQEYIVPHELSTVIEVDSPMSMKFKNQSSRNDAKETSNKSNRSSPIDKGPVEDNRQSEEVKQKESNVNPDILQSNPNFSKKMKLSSDSSEDSKFHMIDLKQFNEIMLEPFITIQEYAKKYNMDPPDEGSNLEEIPREDAINDDMSSLHSDGSLPDVIAELLKRNIITEPFKFDTASNINSTTVSSESTLSMLALSKVRKDRMRTGVVFQNKENIGETSDTMSMSSNPDLENAFKKLGMGWASSTLKKTKERLALSSSSNTSSSSISQFKMKSFNQDIPALVTDSVSSVLNSSKKIIQNKNASDNSRNAEQQTTLSNSMTVKDFLRNELAKKITFNNKSNINDTEGEFVSLFETKMPEEMKETSASRAERSMDSAPSGANRARTSTPVQIFKSMTYRSTSSSNVSNGLFSNADDLSSVKMTSNSNKNHSTSDKDDLTIPNFSLRMKKSSDCSKSD